MGIFTIIIVCCPSAFTLMAVGLALILNKRQVISVSNRQILVIGVISFLVMLTAACLFAQIVSSRLYNG